MREWQSQSHVRWYCKYHIVFVPKYRCRVIYGQLRRRIGPLLVVDCNRNEPGLQSARFPDHILCLYRPPQDHIICI
jgi:putative transposase